ncbi:2835_t:CDS:2 [Funneliformis geosporum]|nr:2835_t:CDS:2 [Funneliformis geosporum]
MGIEIKKVGTNVKTIEIDVKRVGNDVEQVGNDVKEIETDVKELVTEIKQIKQNTENYPDMVLKITAMHNTMEKLTKQTDQSKINKIFQFHNLTFEDYVQGDDRRDDGQVTKWMCDRHQEFAFKVIGDDENDKNSVQNQVTILKEFQDWQNIIKFYGLTNDGSKTYLVTEWAEFGNLREYYTSFRQRFELLKLKLCLDIARGLNFLRTVDIVHRDVRAENIFITVNEVAKLGNFKLSRPLTGPTKKQNQNLERVRYCAPELLERVQNFKYNHKCEVYSFGILLWEIAETRIPYAKYDIMSITDLILKKKYREPFSENNGMSEKFKELVNKAVNPDPDFRPKLSKMVNILGECNKEYVRLSLSDVSSSNFSQSKPKLPTPKRTFSIDNDYEFAIKDENLQDFESFNYMTLAEAEKQHKMVDKNGSPAGDLKNAYKCFEAFARRKQIKAKYYKAYYISKGYDDLDLSTKDKEIMIAGLFKEVANDEANEFPEAKLRYGDCLYHGKGVDQNLTEALKYFEKAAEDGLRVAMYNVGNLYYNGCNEISDYSYYAIVNKYPTLGRIIEAVETHGLENWVSQCITFLVDKTMEENCPIFVGMAQAVMKIIDKIQRGVTFMRGIGEYHESFINFLIVLMSISTLATCWLTANLAGLTI